jgi:hypothetical protein
MKVYSRALETNLQQLANVRLVIHHKERRF